MSVLKELSSVQSLMCLGRVFRREVAATRKALSPKGSVLGSVRWSGGCGTGYGGGADR